MHANNPTKNLLQTDNNQGVVPKRMAHCFSVAPMLDWTDRHCRHLHRLLSLHALLYTEMITADAILHSKAAILAQPEAAYPVAVQLGGCDPKALAQCAKQADQQGYAEINLNVGCPSNRVQQGRFGACLMADAPLVADCIKAMRDQVTIPVTVKTRLGIDQQDAYPFLAEFINTVATRGGCDTFILHARKAWLAGLSPKENRIIPPIDYQRVYRIKRDFPHLNIVINGEIQSLTAVQTHLKKVDGVMIGREAYKHPLLLAHIEHALFEPQAAAPDGRAVVEAFYPYIEKELKLGTPLSILVRPLMGLFHQHPSARKWRRYLSEHCYSSGATLSIVQQALDLIGAVRLRPKETRLADSMNSIE